MVLELNPYLLFVFCVIKGLIFNLQWKCNKEKKHAVHVDKTLQ